VLLEEPPVLLGVLLRLGLLMVWEAKLARLVDRRLTEDGAMVFLHA
jgi:hypothetical protein